MENIHLNMGEIIRELRKSKALTQDALAQSVGVSVQAVSKWENAQSLPDVTLLPSIADFFEVSMDALFGRTAPAPEAESAKEEIPSPVSFPDDDKLRVVQFMGSRLMSSEECEDGKCIPLAIDKYEGKLDMEIQGSARINGPVNGLAHAAGDIYISGSVNGSASANGDIHCEGAINGPARASGDVHSRNRSHTAPDVGETVRSSLSEAFSGMGSIFSGMFGNRRTGGAVGAHMNAFFSGQLPDDDVLRVVQMQGRRILAAEESAGEKVIRLAIDHYKDTLNVEVYGSADVRGSVSGNVRAGDSLNCGPVSGNASAGDSMNCGNIGGNASAGDDLTCGTVGGNAKAGDSIRVTGDVGGNVSAGDSVTCGNVMGDIVGAAEVHCNSAQGRTPDDRKSGRKSASFHAGMDINADDMPDFSAASFKRGVLNVVQVMDGRILSCEESRDDRAIRLCLEDADGVNIEVHGDAVIEGSVEGSVSAGGSVNCEGVEGDVSAGGSVNCGGVEGDVSAGGMVTCGGVEGDVSAGGQVNCGGVEGDVAAGSAVSCGDVEGDVSACGKVSCGDVGGDVRIDGGNPNASLECGNIGGDLTAKGAVVSCGEIWGNTSIEGSNSNASLECGNIGGSLTATGAAVSCGDIEGDATVENASLRYGSVGGVLRMNNSNISPNE